MNYEVLNAHVCKLTSYLLKARVCLLVYLGIDSLNSFLTVGVQGVAFRTAYVAAPVKTVYSKVFSKKCGSLFRQYTWRRQVLEEGEDEGISF